MVTQEVGESSRGRKERGEQSALQHHVPREVGRSSLDRPLLGDEEAKLKQTCSSSSVFRSEAGAQHESDVTTACIDSAASCQRPVPKNVPQANAAGNDDIQWGVL